MIYNQRTTIVNIDETICLLVIKMNSKNSRADINDLKQKI